jgi:putative transposase
MGRPSRSIFKPDENEKGVYLHVYNHCVEGVSREFPFRDTEKEKFLKHLKKTLTLYSIECLSAVCMSNHYHLILYVPKDILSAGEMVKRIVSYKKGKVVIEAGDHYCQRRMEMSNDLSSFMKELQQSFTCWYNRTRDYKRRGTLWEQRFKCVKLADSEALATCLQYVELNPVRAEIVDDPAKYRFCTYGIWQQSGKHPYAKDFKKHMTKALDIYLDCKDMVELGNYFRRRFAGIIVGEQGGDMLEVNLARKKASKQINPLLIRSRFWIDSLVLGSKISLKEHAVNIWGNERGQKKKFGKAYEENDTQIFSMRQLQIDI